MNYRLIFFGVCMCAALAACRFDNTGQNAQEAAGPPADTFRVEIDTTLLAPLPEKAEDAGLRVQPPKGFEVFRGDAVENAPGAEEDFGRLASMLRINDFELEMLLADTATSAMVALARTAPLADSTAAFLLANAKQRNTELKEWDVFSIQRVVLNDAKAYQLMLRAANQEVVALLFPRTDAPSALLLAQLPVAFTSQPENMRGIQSMLGTAQLSRAN